MTRTSNYTIGVSATKEEYDAFADYCVSNNLNRALYLRSLISQATGVELLKRRMGLSPETIAERWLSKNTRAEVRAALLKALTNSHGD